MDKKEKNILALIASIHDLIVKSMADQITGELCIRIPFSQGGIGQVRVNRDEILNKKP